MEQVTELVNAIVVDWFGHRRRRKHGKETFAEFTVRRESIEQDRSRAAKQARKVFTHCE